MSKFKLKEKDGGCTCQQGSCGEPIKTEPTAFPCPHGGFHCRTIFKRLCWRMVHCQVSFLFPKGQGVAVTGVYECMDCKAAGRRYCFRGFDPGAISKLPPLVKSELYDPWIITPKWIVERSLSDRVRISRDNTHEFARICNIYNEEKVMGYMNLTERFFIGSIASRMPSLCGQPPPATKRRANWQSANGDLADVWPLCKEEAYGCTLISVHIIALMYIMNVVLDLVDITRRIQMLGGEWLSDDQSHKAAKKMGAVATDKRLNNHKQIVDYNISTHSKSQAPYQSNKDILFVERLKQLDKDGVCPKPRCLVSDDPKTDEARWKDLMTWLPCGDPDRGRLGTAVRLVAPEGTIVVDRHNFADLSRLLALLWSNAYYDPARRNHVIAFDAEWQQSAFHADGIDALGLSSAKTLLIIRCCDLPDPKQLPACLVSFLSAGPIKVGCCIGNDLKRLHEGHGVVLSPVVKLDDLARQAYSEPTGQWGLERLCQTFGPEASFVSGKFSVACRHSNWTAATPNLTTKQISYLAVDVLACMVLYNALSRRLLINKVSAEKASEPKVPCKGHRCGSAHGHAGLGGRDADYCAACFAAKRYGVCWCPINPATKCILCQFKPDAQADAAAADPDVQADMDMAVGFKVDPFHPMAGVLEAAGVSHTSHGAAATCLSMICFLWEAAVYNKLLQHMITKYNVSEVVARFMIVRLRRTQPELVRTWIPPPSILLPLLDAWWGAFARQWCEKSKQLLLDRPKVKAKFDRFRGLIVQGRFHDGRPISEMSTEVGTRSDGIKIWKSNRPTTSPHEAWHLLEHQVLGHNKMGLVIASLILLSLIMRTNFSRSVDHCGAQTFGIGDVHMFILRRMLALQQLASMFPRIFTKKQRKCIDLNGDLSLRPCTGERFAAFAESPAWDELRHPDWKCANLLQQLTSRNAELEAHEDGLHLPSSDVRVMIAHADPGRHVFYK